MKSKQCNERAKANHRDQAMAQRAATPGKEEGLPLEMIEGMVRQSIRDAYRVIAVTNRHINKSTSLITRTRAHR